MVLEDHVDYRGLFLLSRATTFDQLSADLEDSGFDVDYHRLIPSRGSGLRQRRALHLPDHGSPLSEISISGVRIDTSPQIIPKKKKPAYSFGRQVCCLWCGRWDLNPYDRLITAPSRQRVCRSTTSARFGNKISIRVLGRVVNTSVRIPLHFLRYIEKLSRCPISDYKTYFYR